MGKKTSWGKSKKRVIFSHHKNLNKGDFLIDDRTKRGAKDFEGELILFGKKPFYEWSNVLEYITDKIEDNREKTDAKREIEHKKDFERSIDWEFTSLRMEHDTNEED